MDNLENIVTNIILDASKCKFAKIPNMDLALSCQSYAEQIAPEVVRQLLDGNSNIVALRDITSQHAKKEFARVVTKFGTTVMMRVSENLSDESLKQLLNEEIVDTLQTGWESYLDGEDWQQDVEKRVREYATGYAKKISHQAFDKAKNYFPEKNYYMAFCDDAENVANSIVEAVEKGETIESICASVRNEVKSSLIQHGTDYVDEKFGQGIDAAINFAADNMREKGRGKRHSAYNKRVDWAADAIKDSVKGNSGDAISRLLDGDDAGAVVEDFVKETARNVAQKTLDKYADEYISDSVNSAVKHLHVTGKGSKKINRRINDAGGVVSESLTNNVTANVADVLAGNKDFDTAVKDIATETVKQSVQTYVREHGAEFTEEVCSSSFAKNVGRNVKKGGKKFASVLKNNKSDFVRGGISIVGSVSASALDGATGAIQGAAPLIMANAIADAWKVATGEKSCKQAIKENARMVTDVGMAGAGEALLQEGIKQGLSKGIVDPKMVKFMDTPEFGQAVFLGIQVARSGVRYINGEINDKEMATEIATITIAYFGGKAGSQLGMALGNAVLPGVGGAVGAYVGQTIGYLVTSIACNLIVETVVHRDDYKRYETQIKQFTDKAIAEMQELRSNFENLVQEKYGKWEKTINNSISIMTQCAYMEVMSSDDIDATNNAMKDVLELFGFRLKYTTNEEFLNDWGKPLKLSISF